MDQPELQTPARAIFWACAAGVLIPVMYLGVQLLALPFAAGYSPLRQTASELGMAGVSTHPGLFSLGTGLRAIPTILAALGLLSGLRALRARTLATWLVFLSMLSIAINDVGAAMFPLPDPRHEGLFLLGYFVWPFSIVAAVGKLPDIRRFQAYMWFNIAVTLLLVVIRATLPQEAFTPVAGLFQRVLALVSVLPLGVASWVVAQRCRTTEPSR